MKSRAQQRSLGAQSGFGQKKLDADVQSGTRHNGIIPPAFGKKHGHIFAVRDESRKKVASEPSNPLSGHLGKLLNIDKTNLAFLHRYLSLEDIYYKPSYASLYLEKNYSSLFSFEYRNKNKVFFNIAIKKPILKIGNHFPDKIYYDLESPYGYGGFFSNSDDEDFLKVAMALYTERCMKEDIIAEFIRFHPFNEFPYRHSHFLDICKPLRETVMIPLEKDYNDIYTLYNPALKRNIKKAFRNQLFCKKLDSRNCYIVSDFIRLYYKTMERHNADNFYFFPEDYFYSLFKLPEVELFGVYCGKKLINAVIIMHSPEIIYYHLGATDSEYYNLNANPFIFDFIIRLYCKQKKFFFLGGGVTDSPDDSLLKFKKKFFKYTIPFYIGGKIYNKKKYEKFVTIWEDQASEDLKNRFFCLKYRLPLRFGKNNAY